MEKPFDIPVETWAKFLDYHKANAWIWPEFERRALDLVNSGCRHIGAKCLMEVVRYFTTTRDNGGLKINNNFIAYFARAFEQKHNCQGFFELREIKGLRD